MNAWSRHPAAIAALLCLVPAFGARADTIKIAQIDPLSGPFGLVGESLSRHLDATVEEINAAGGVLGGTKLEVVHFDNKASAQESVLLLKQVIDSGIRYVTQGGGSNVAHALCLPLMSPWPAIAGSRLTIHPASSSERADFGALSPPGPSE